MASNQFIARKGIISLDDAQITGSLSVTGNISASIFTGSFVGDGSQLTGVAGAATASYVEYTNVANKPALVSGSSQVSFNGIVDKPTLVSGSSQITYSGLSSIPAGIVSGSSQVSFNGIVDKPTLISGSSQVTYGELSGIPVGIVSSSTQITGYNIFATTGSNQFNGSQAITGSLTVTGQVVAQTLNVQQVTSSIVFSSGSNIFGNSLSNTQQFTGSVSVTGSVTVAGAGTFAGSVATGGNITVTANSAAVRVTESGGADVRMVAGGSSGFFGTYSNHPLIFLTNSENKLTLSTSGNLGLGVTPSAWATTFPSFKAIEVGALGNALWSSGAVDFTMTSNAFFDGSWKYAFTANATRYQQLDGNHRWYNAPSGTAGCAISFTQAMTLSTAGRLLIGKTNDEGFTLDVNGTGRFSGSVDITGTGDVLVLRKSNNVPAVAFIGTSTNKSVIEGGDNFDFYTGNIKRLTIASTGAACFACELTAKSLGTNDLILNNLNHDYANYVDGTRGSWLIQEGACDLFIINQVSCKKYKFNLIEIN